MCSINQSLEFCEVPFIDNRKCFIVNSSLRHAFWNEKFESQFVITERTVLNWLKSWTNFVSVPTWPKPTLSILFTHFGFLALNDF